MTSNVFRRVLASGATLICALPLLATEVYVNAITGSDTEHGGTSPSDAWTSFMATAPVGAGLWTLDFGCPNASAFPTGYSTIIDVTGTPGFLFLSGEKTWMVK